MFSTRLDSRGVPRSAPADAEEGFDTLPIAATEPPRRPPAIMTAQGERRLSERVADPVLRLLEEGPTTIGTLVDRAVRTGVERQQARQAVTAMVAGGIAVALASLRPTAEAIAACDAFNREALARAKRGDTWPALASPLLGSGIALGAVEQRALAGVLPEMEAVRAEEDDMQKLEAHLARLDARRPYLQHLGVVPPGSADC